MTAVQMGLTIAVCTAATMLTRFLPFLIFSSKEQQPPEVVRYLGRVLPAAIFGSLLPEGRYPVLRQPRHPGSPCAAGYHRAAQVEAPDPAQRGGGHFLLCTAGAAGILKNGSVIEGVKVHLTVEPLLQLVKAFAVLRQQPHTFGHHGLDGHIVGL